MHAWQAVQESLDYIEDHLSEDMPVDLLASTAALSPFYYQRLFFRLVKKPVYEYIKLRRLAKASLALQNTDKRIIDIALDNGFSDPANFSRAFKDAYGITPEAFRTHPVILNQFIKPDLRLKYARIEENEPLITDGMVIEITRRTLTEPRTIVGITGWVPNSDLAGGRTTGIAVTGEIWAVFHDQKVHIPNLLPEGNEIGILYGGKPAGEFGEYLAGAEAGSALPPEDYTAYTLPSGPYAVCGFEAENFAELIGSAIFKASAFMRRWMRRSNLVCGDFAAEVYSTDDTARNRMELWLPIHPPATFEERNRGKNETKNHWAQPPSMEALSASVNHVLWDEINDTLAVTHQSKPILEYSRCSYQPGWNVKYKKGGRTLCTLYPLAGYFNILVVIGQSERAEFETALPSLTPYLQKLYSETKSAMGQKWLMITVTGEDVLEDVKKCIAIRSGKKSKNRRNQA